MFGRSRKPKITLQQMLGSKPLRLVDAEAVPAGEGRWHLPVPVRPAGWARWFLRVPVGTTKTFELDPLGHLVWQQCDGKTTVQQVIRRLAKQYNLNVREAEVATLAFLRVLAKKGLVGMSVRQAKKQPK